MFHCFVVFVNVVPPYYVTVWSAFHCFYFKQSLRLSYAAFDQSSIHSSMLTLLEQAFSILLYSCFEDPMTDIWLFVCVRLLSVCRWAASMRQYSNPESFLVALPYRLWEYIRTTGRLNAFFAFLRLCDDMLYCLFSRVHFINLSVTPSCHALAQISISCFALLQRWLFLIFDISI